MTTDYKQCLAFVEQMGADVGSLTPRLVRDDPERAHALLSLNLDARGGPLLAKSGRLLLRARETDPDRQMYGDSMCAKIEALQAAAAAAVAPYEAVAEAVEAAYAAHLRALAATAAWEAVLTTGLSAVELREGQARTLLRLDAKAAATAVVRLMAVGARVARTAWHLREGAAWEAELARRRMEGALAAALAAAAVAGVVGRAAAALERRAPGAARRCSQRLGGLLEEVAVRPEDVAVRTLRCNNASVMAHFGHPGARTEGGAPGPGAARWAFSEAVLGTVGYAATYTDVETLPPDPAALGDGPAAIAGGGWEPYGERLLALREPDAAVDPDGWVAWHARLRALTQLLRRIARGE